MKGNQKEGQEVERHLFLTLDAGPLSTSLSPWGWKGVLSVHYHNIQAVMQSGNIIRDSRALLKALLTPASMTHA